MGNSGKVYKLSLSAILISRTYQIHVLLSSFDFLWGWISYVYSRNICSGPYKEYGIKPSTSFSLQGDFSCFIRCLYWPWNCQFFDNFSFFYSFTLRSYFCNYLNAMQPDLPIFVKLLNLLIKLLLDFYSE